MTSGGGSRGAGRSAGSQCQRWDQVTSQSVSQSGRQSAVSGSSHKYKVIQAVIAVQSQDQESTKCTGTKLIPELPQLNQIPTSWCQTPQDTLAQFQMSHKLFGRLKGDQHNVSQVVLMIWLILWLTEINNYKMVTSLNLKLMKTRNKTESN